MSPRQRNRGIKRAAAAAGAGVAPLTWAERLDVIDALCLVLDGVYSHLPLKRSLYGFDVIRGLEHLRQQVPIVTGFTPPTGTVGAYPLVTQDSAGIILTVTPRISPEENIVMEVVAEKSAFTGAGVPLFVDPTTGNQITSPIKDISTARTVVGVPNGQTIVLGGMISKNDETIERKVPWLGDLPVIGLPFRYRLFESLARPQVERAVVLDIEAFKRRLESVAGD